MKDYQYSQILGLLFMIWGCVTPTDLLSLPLMVLGAINMFASLYQQINK